MPDKKIAIRIIPTPATQDISSKSLQRLARIVKLDPQAVTDRISRGKGLTLIAEDHPKVEELVSLIKSIGFSVTTGPVEKPRHARLGPAKAQGSAARVRETEWKVGDIIENLYEVQQIKQGGMGSVYVVRHRRWNTMMAVKSLLPRLIENEEERALFVKEAETWIDIGFHPNIASCYYVRNIRESPRIFIEYIDAGSINEWLNRHRPVGWDLVIDLMVQAGDGLDHAHSKGLVHRDVKPANCLMTKDGLLKVTDFGLTKRQSLGAVTSGTLESQNLEIAVRTREDITAAGMGTPGYMAPEMWIPHADVGPQADVYAFGVMFFELCCGRKPFVLKPGENRSKLALAHVRKNPPRPGSLRPDIPPQLEKIIIKCLEKSPEKRYPSFLAMREELESIYERMFKTRYPRERPDEIKLISDALNNRAVSLMDLNHEDEAQHALDTALESDPHHPEAVYNHGLLGWLRSGNPDWEIVTRMEEVVKTPQYLGRGSHLLGRCLLTLGDAARALKASERSLSAEDATEEWLKPYAVALIGTGQEKDAIGHLDTYLTEFPNDDEASGWLIGALVRNGRIEEASSRLRALPPGAEIAGLDLEKIPSTFTYSGLAETLVIGGHAGWVTCVSHFPKSPALITGTRDRTLKIWDAVTGEEKKSFTLVGEPPAALWISPDESLVAIGSSQSSFPVKVLDLASGRFVGNLVAQDRITAVGFSPDGKTVLTAEDKGIVRVWESPEFKVAATFKVPAHSAAAIAFDKESKPEIFLAGLDRIVKKVRPPDLEAIAFERGHREALTALTASPDGGLVLTAGRDKQAIVWDGRSGKLVTVFPAHQEQIAEVALNPLRGLAASYDARAGIKVWDSRTGMVFRTFSGGEAEINCMAFTPDGNRLMAGGKDMTLRIWAVNGRASLPGLALAKIRPVKKQMKSDRKFKVMVETAIKAIKVGAYATAYSMLQDSRQLPGYERSDAALELIVRMKDHGTRVGLRGGWNRKTFDTASGVMSVSFSPSGINFLTSQADHTIRLWSTKTGDCLKVLRGHTNLVASVCFSASGREAASGSDDRSVRIWDLNSGKNLSVLKGHMDNVSTVAYSPDGSLLLSGSWDGTLRLWRHPQGGLLKTLKGPGDKITSAAFVEGTERIVSAGFDGVLRMWDVSSGRILRELKGHKDKVMSQAVSPNFDVLLSGSADGTARLWDTKTGTAIRVLQVDESGVRTVAFSPDQRFLITGSQDGVLRIWNVERGDLLREFQGHSREITSAGFSPDERFAISSSADGLVMIWEVDWEWRFDENKARGKPEPFL